MNLVQWDEESIKYIHQNLHFKVLDIIMPYLRQPMFWVPVYGFIICFILYNYKRKGLFIIGLAIITFIITDQVSSHVLKPYIERLRPCQDVRIVPYLRQLVQCGAGHSFPSSHAANHFGLSTFLIIVFGRKFPYLWIPLILWAFLVSFAQVYVGLHYPVDVLFGALLGYISGTLIGNVARLKVNLDEDI